MNDDTSLVARVAKADYACNGQLNLMRTAGLSPMLRGIAVSAFARVHPLSKGHGGFHNGLFLRLDALSTYSSRMQVLVMNVLKGAGLFNSYKLCTVFDYDTPTCHSGLHSTKHGRNSKDVTFLSQIITQGGCP